MNNNFNFQQGSNITNNQGGGENSIKAIVIGIVVAIIAGLILFYVFGIK